MTAVQSGARRRIGTARGLAALAVLAVVLPGCSNDHGRPEDDRPSGPEAGPTQGDGEPAGDGQGATAGVLTQLLAQIDSEPDDTQLTRVEELTAECMADAGFEYVPVDVRARRRATEAVMAASEGRPVFGTLEYAEQWGYGITTRGTAGASGASGGVAGPDEWVNPNDDVYAALSDPERAAYGETLWGPDAEEPADPDAEWEAPSWEQLGCYGAAQHEVYGEGPSDDPGPYADLWEEIGRVEEAVLADERVLAAVADWSSCMAGAGHPGLAALADAEQAARALVEAAQPSDDALARLREQEIEIAVADATCRAEVGYDDAYAEADLELQQRFYDEHRTELEEYAAYVESRY